MVLEDALVEVGGGTVVGDLVEHPRGEELLLDGFSEIENHPQTDAMQVRWQVIDWIARFYENRGRTDEAAAWRARSPWKVPPADLVDG